MPDCMLYMSYSSYGFYYLVACYLFSVALKICSTHYNAELQEDRAEAP